MNNAILFIIVFSLQAFGVSAQPSRWSLTECVEAAQKNSYARQLQLLEVAGAEAAHRNPLLDFLPTVQLNGNHIYNFGSVIEPSTNSRVSSQIQSNNFSLDARVNLLDANSFANARKNEWDIKAAQASREMVEQELTLKVIQQYFAVIYAAEWLKAQQRQLENTAYNLHRIEKEVALGNKSNSDLYDMQLAYSQDQNKILETRQSLQNNKLLLLQLMNVNLANPDDFDVTEVQPLQLQGTYALDTAYTAAIANRPESRYYEYQRNSLSMAAKIRRNAVLPSISAFYSYGSFYFKTLNQPGGDTFWKQLGNNKNHYAGLSLNIPLFDAFRTRQNVQRALVEVDKNETRRKQENQKIYQTLEQDILTARQAADMLRSQEEVAGFARESFQTTEAKFVKDKTDAYVYTASKNQLLNAEYGLLKSRYTMTYLDMKIRFLQTGKL